ncbi:hypothetical protein [Natrarchaeobaculum aegyptiacum]|uniref:Uncharacterized protein n=1 Tax=Natrarchaeobaculum aegyptiacum TaxID=745377 RepID=A0A2Z2HT36_9EURY|nr:hypothetical protein [Natrarchaeobaculum aegyptiacum]ARS90302.1 hypothetical protein B1756_11595 [Natrarchaeobaculum aegyptiacum]
MTRSRLVIGILLLVGGLVLVGATAGVSSVTLDRSLGVAIADDADAAIGIEHQPSTASDQNGTSVEEVFVTNRIEEPVTVHVTGVNAPGLVDVESPETVDPGERDVVAVTIDCRQSTEPALVDVTVTGGDRTIEQPLEVEPTCAESSQSSDG